MEMIRRRKRLSEPEARYLSLQLLDALRYMHTNKVIHRDLKLGNLFLNSTMDIKVGDLGLATLLSHETERKRTICGTPNYIAPEILMNASDGHSFEVDMWSFGVILYTLVVGKPPFETKDVKTTYRRIKTNQYSFPPGAPVSEAAQDLITRLLAHEPQNRPDLTAALQHPWFTDPSALVPRHLPMCSLTALPHFSPSELRQSADAVADILAVTPGPLQVRASARRSTPVDANGRSTDENTYTSMNGKPLAATATAAAPAPARAPLGRVDSNAHGGAHTHSRGGKPAQHLSAPASAGFMVYTGPENTAPPAQQPAVRTVAPPHVPTSAPSLGGSLLPLPQPARHPPEWRPLPQQAAVAMGVKQRPCGRCTPP
jgi:polo-like kinase 1